MVLSNGIGLGGERRACRWNFDPRPFPASRRMAVRAQSPRSFKGNGSFAKNCALRFANDRACSQYFSRIFLLRASRTRVAIAYGAENLGAGEGNRTLVVSLGNRQIGPLRTSADVGER